MVHYMNSCPVLFLGSQKVRLEKVKHQFVIGMEHVLYWLLLASTIDQPGDKKETSFKNHDNAHDFYLHSNQLDI